MRRGGHRNWKGVLPKIQGSNLYSPPADTGVQVAPAVTPETDDLAHFKRLVRSQGIEAAAKAFTKAELTKVARANNFTYLNPRARKIDLAHALMGET